MEVSDDLYRIGTVANLTGVAVERLRAWERRYGLAPAHRDGRTRYYSGAQLSRLKRIKQLIDQGHPISSLAGLSHEQLGRRLAQSRPVAEAVPQVGLVGPNVVRLVPHEGAGDGLQVAASWVNMAAFMAGSEAAPALDALIVQVPVLTIQPIEYIKEKFPDTHIVLVYQYAADKHLRRAQDLDADLLEWPVDWPQLARACAAAPRRAEGFSERRFTDAELVAMATSDADPSGCPGHLVELIFQLNAFADYMQSCAEADEATAESAALHRSVRGEASKARAGLEKALAAFGDSVAA